MCLFLLQNVLKPAFRTIQSALFTSSFVDAFACFVEQISMRHDLDLAPSPLPLPDVCQKQRIHFLSQRSIKCVLKTK